MALLIIVAEQLHCSLHVKKTWSHNNRTWRTSWKL